MTTLLKPVRRSTASAPIFERGHRRVVVTLLPGDCIGFRLERTRREYVLPIADCNRCLDCHSESSVTTGFVHFFSASRSEQLAASASPRPDAAPHNRLSVSPRSAATANCVGAETATPGTKAQAYRESSPDSVFELPTVIEGADVVDVTASDLSRRTNLPGPAQEERTGLVTTLEPCHHNELNPLAQATIFRDNLVTLGLILVAMVFTAGVLLWVIHA